MVQDKHDHHHNHQHHHEARTSTRRVWVNALKGIALWVTLYVVQFLLFEQNVLERNGITTTTTTTAATIDASTTAVSITSTRNHHSESEINRQEGPHLNSSTTPFFSDERVTPYWGPEVDQSKDYDYDDLAWMEPIANLTWYNLNYSIDREPLDCHAMESNQFITTNCSCLNPLDSPSSALCCSRQVMKNHKHGSFLTNSILNKYVPPRGAVKKYDPKVQGDYRMLVSLRNFYDAIVSGYLYHKDGRECHKNPKGGPLRTNMIEEYRSYMWPLIATSAPGNHTWAESVGHRSLCQYLEQEDEETGMRAYVYYASANYFGKIFRMYIRHHNDCNRTKILCYDQALGIKDQFSSAWIYNHYYPDRPPLPSKPPDNANINWSVSSSAHGTTRDPTVRSRLLWLVRTLDDQIWDGSIARANALFGCRGELEDQHHQPWNQSL